MRKSIKFWVQYVLVLAAMLFISIPTMALSDIPTLKIELLNLAKYYSPNQYVTISYEVSGSFEDTLTAQLVLDGNILAANAIKLDKDSSSTKSQLRASLPETLIDGEHVLGVQLLFEDTVICEELQPITITLPDLGLLADGRALALADVINFASDTTNCTVAFSTRNPLERITSIVTSNQTFSTSTSTKTVSFTLDKSQSEVCSVTVKSACGSQEKVYTITVTRGSNITSLSASILSELGNEYTAALKNGIYEFSLPTYEQKGVLTLKTQDNAARISSFNGLSNDSHEVNANFDLSAGDIYYVVTAQTTERTDNYSIHITNANFTPAILLTNAAEIAGTTYGSNGIYHGGYTEYGASVTSVQEARYAGKTHGIIVEIEAADVNLGQYLAGSLELHDSIHKVHWGSFDGPTFTKTGESTKGYIYIDSSYFTENIPMAFYTLAVSDYSDATLNECLSTTTLSISFAVTVSAGKLTAYFDQSMHQIILSSSSSGAFTYRKSLDNGVTWSEELSAADIIDVTDEGTSLYEITLTDSMRNTTKKLVTASIPKSGAQLDGINIFLSTTRHADYIYLNTKKQNIDTMDIAVFKLFADISED